MCYDSMQFWCVFTQFCRQWREMVMTVGRWKTAAAQRHHRTVKKTTHQTWVGRRRGSVASVRCCSSVNAAEPCSPPPAPPHYRRDPSKNWNRSGSSRSRLVPSTWWMGTTGACVVWEVVVMVVVVVVRCLHVDLSGPHLRRRHNVRVGLTGPHPRGLARHVNLTAPRPHTARVHLTRLHPAASPASRRPRRTWAAAHCRRESSQWPTVPSVWRATATAACCAACPAATRSTSSALWVGWAVTTTAVRSAGGPRTRQNRATYISMMTSLGESATVHWDLAPDKLCLHGPWIYTWLGH